MSKRGIKFLEDSMGDEPDSALGGKDSGSRLLKAQLELLRAHAAGEDLETLFKRVVHCVEAEINGATASILLFDARRNTLSAACAPNLPPEFVEMLHDAPVGDLGTCAKAAHSREIVIVHDTSADPLWNDFRELADRFNFGASWSHPFFDPDGELLGTLGLYFDSPRNPSPYESDVHHIGAYLLGLFVSQHRTKESLRENERRFRTLVENASDVLLLLDEDGRIEYAAPNADQVLGEGFVGRHLREVTSESKRVDTAIKDALSGAERVVLEDLPTGARSSRWLRCSLNPRTDAPGLVAVVSDVTQRRTVDAQLQFAERMSTVGTLAAGIAHEINNPVAYVSGNLVYLHELLTELFRHDPGHEALEAIHDALEGTNRVAEIVSDLNAFTRGTTRKLRPVKFGDVVLSAIRLVRPQIRRHVSLEVDIQGDPIAVGNNTELGQVVVNLVLNAAHALGKKNGKIGIKAYADQEHVWLIVSDNGPGIPRDVQQRIFEPFFTTKGPERGTGLGLSIVHGIIKRHDAQIDVQSEIGQGTTFTIRLPKADAIREGSDEPDKLNPIRILFVDDEVALANSMTRILSEHEVHIETSGDAAVAQLERDQGYDLIMLDLIMPEKSGAQTYLEITNRWPELESRITFVSGGPISEESRDLVERDPNRFLAKPFSRRQIAQFISNRIA